MADIGAFDILNNISKGMEDVLTQFVTTPVDILTAGVLIMAYPAMCCWFMYRCYLVMAGLQSESLTNMLHEFIIKSLILLTAGGLAFSMSDIQNIMQETPLALVKDLTGEVSVLDIIGNQIDVYLDLLAEEDAKKYGVRKLWAAFMAFFKIIVIVAVFLWLAITTLLVILINKTFLMLGVGFAPLFIAFLAFDKTKGWFQGWLNTTLGYGMSYAVVMFSAFILLKGFEKLFANGTSWIEVLSSIVLASFLAIIIGRVGDIASAWFGAGNIADGTAAAGLGSTMLLGNRAKKFAVEAGKGLDRKPPKPPKPPKPKKGSILKGGARLMGRGARAGARVMGQGAKAAYNALTKKNIKAGSSNSGNLKTNANPETNTNKPTNSNANTKGNTPSGNHSGNLKGSSGFSSGNKAQGSGGSGANVTPTQRPRNTATHPPKLNNNRKK